MLYFFGSFSPRRRLAKWPLTLTSCKFRVRELSLSMTCAAVVTPVMFATDMNPLRMTMHSECEQHDEQDTRCPLISYKAKLRDNSAAVWVIIKLVG